MTQQERGLKVNQIRALVRVAKTLTEALVEENLATVFGARLEGVATALDTELYILRKIYADIKD